MDVRIMMTSGRRSAGPFLLCLLAGVLPVLRPPDATAQSAPTIVWQGSHGRPVSALEFHPDGATMLTAGDAQTVKVWVVASGDSRVIDLNSSRTIADMQVAADGSLFAVSQFSGGYGGAPIGLWQMDGTSVGFLETPQSSAVLALSFSPDGEFLAAGDTKNHVTLWRVSTREFVRDWLAAVRDVTAVAFSPNSELLATGGKDARVRMWRLSDGALLYTAIGHPNWITNVQFSPDGELLACAGRDSRIRVLRAVDGELVQTLSGHADRVMDIDFSSDGNMFASASLDETIRLWRVQDGRLRHFRTFDALTEGGVTAIAFSPDNRFFGYGRGDGSVVLAVNEPPTPGPGDLNCDAFVDALDIEPFLVALFDPESYPLQYPDCDINNGDINGDGSINALDIEGFLGLLFP